VNAPLIQGTAWPKDHAASPRPGGPSEYRAATSCETLTARRLAYLYGRDNLTEAIQAKVLTADRRGGSPATSRGCRSCSGKPGATNSRAERTSGG
jgi:hypothetical protein